MRQSSSVAMLVALAGLFGCSSSSSPVVATPSYNSVAGTLSFPVSGTSGNVPLAARMTFHIAQHEGSLSGTDSLAGTLNGTTPIADSYILTGTIAEGADPLVSFTLIPASCPNVHETFSGTETTDGVLLLTGLFFVFNPDCSVALTYTLNLPIAGRRPGASYGSNPARGAS
jgi:hypothetical protein